MRFFIAGMLGLIAVASGRGAWGDGQAPEQVIQEWRPAMVVVEVNGSASATAPDRSSRRGSGVAVGVRGDLLTILTAARVVEPSPAAVAVICDPGTPTERRFAGRVASVHPEAGIAFIEAPKVTSPPRPLTLPALAGLVPRSRESRPVFLLGHVLERIKLPPIVLAKGSAATEGPMPEASVLPLRVDGAHDRGYAGGLVLSIEGQALGIATGAPTGGLIDQFIPLDAIVRATEPRLVDLRFEPRPRRGPVADTKGGPPPTTVGFAARLDDPLGTTASVGLAVTAKSTLPGGPVLQPNGSWEPILYGSRPTSLVLTNGEVSGRFEVFEDSDTDRSFWVQPNFLDNARGPRLGKPVLYRYGQGIVPDPVVPVPNPAVAARPASAPVVPAPAAASRPATATAATRPGTEDEPQGGFGSAAARPPEPRRGAIAAATDPNPGPGVVAPRGGQRKGKVDEPQGGFAELKDPGNGGKPRDPVASGAALGLDEKSIDGLGITTLDLPAADVLPCLTWSADGKAFFIAEKAGQVRRVRAEGLVEEVRLDTKVACSWLSLSAEGLLLTVEATGEVWVLDPETLKFRFKLPVPSAERVVASPALGVAFGVGGKNNDAALSVIDLKRKKIVKQFGPRDIPGGDDGFKHLAVTPDGKYLFCQGGIEQLQRYRIKGTALEPQEASERLAQNGRSIVISPDGYYVALPSGGGNYNAKSYSTLIFKITDLKKPAITIQSGAYPQTLGFDLKAGLIYAQNHQFPLIIFSPSGIKQKESKLGGRAGDDARQFLVYPSGRQVLVLTESRLLTVRVPKDDE